MSVTDNNVRRLTHKEGRSADQRNQAATAHNQRLPPGANHKGAYLMGKKKQEGCKRDPDLSLVGASGSPMLRRLAAGIDLKKAAR